MFTIFRMLRNDSLSRVRDSPLIIKNAAVMPSRCCGVAILSVELLWAANDHPVLRRSYVEIQKGFRLVCKASFSARTSAFERLKKDAPCHSPPSSVKLASMSPR